MWGDNNEVSMLLEQFRLEVIIVLIWFYQINTIDKAQVKNMLMTLRSELFT